MTKANFTTENAFVRGFRACRVCDTAAIKREIMQSLNLRNDKAYYNRKFGFVRHSPYERQGIERTFARYGVRADTIWGLAEQAPAPAAQNQ